jgi:hypothetical protein
MRYTWTVNHRVVSRRWEMFLNQILRNVAPGPCPIRVFWARRTICARQCGYGDAVGPMSPGDPCQGNLVTLLSRTELQPQRHLWDHQGWHATLGRLM